MLCNWTRLLWVAVVLLILSAGRSHAGVVSEHLLPNTTKGVVLVTDAKNLSDTWQKTQLGQLMTDPVMKPFSEDLRRQFSERFGQVNERLGLRLDDLRGVPGGGLAMARIMPEKGDSKGKSAIVIAIDVTGHIAEAKALLAKVEANLLARGAKQTQKAVTETTAAMIFELQETQDYAGGQAAFCLAGNLLAASDNVAVLQQIMRRNAGQTAQGDSLADEAAFQAVMKRCQAHAGATVPQIRWFIQPLGYIEALRAATPDDKRPSGTTILSIFEQQGFTAIKGIGGFVDFMVDGCEVLHRTAIYAPRPYKVSPPPYKDLCPMEMLTFPNHKDFTLPGWVPNDVATCTQLYWDALKAFDNFGPLFDQVVGEGESGAWGELMESFRDDPIAGEIDIRGELIKHLGQRLIVISDNKLPITTTSERLLVAIEVGDAKAMAAGIKKLFDGDPTMKAREFEGLVIWETVEEEEYKAPSPPSISVPQFSNKKKRRPRPRGKDAGDEGPQALEHSAITVAHGQLMIGSHYDFLVEVLKQAKDPDPISESLDFKVVTAAMNKLGAGDGCLRSFSRTDEEYRPGYEMIRQGKMPQSESVLGRILNAMLGPKKRGMVRKAGIDGKELPDFQVVGRYLGPAGEFVVTEDDGWFAVGFMLKK